MPQERCKECDIVMKGGVTSGVVYPGAVLGLSSTYRFRNIGGTSAGAIAAALTAAAEYGRQCRSGTAFEGLGRLPEWLATDGHLFGLFRPNASTRSTFWFLMKLLETRRDKFLVALTAAPYQRKTASLSLLGLGLAVGIAGGVAHVHWLIALGAAFALVTPSLWACYLLFRSFMQDIPRNFFGLCTGLDERHPNDTTVLTSWLADLIDQVSGADHPLTFGDLWRTGGGVAHAAPLSALAQGRSDERADRGINLEMITTNITHGRPYRFPFDTNIFYFDPREFMRFFPPRVVQWMIDHSRKPANDRDREHIAAARPLLPLPQSADIPIVVSARMSLSFPVLISAVPLYAVDWTIPQDDKRPKLERCWFSDGGISSNFPIHLFDGPLPNRPTFGIDLDSFTTANPEDPNNQANNVWMPPTNEAGIGETWTRFSDQSLGGFLGAILNAMQNWQDNTQSRVPGFRDRIAHVYLSADEGGLNLNMGTALLNRLAERGTCAGALLAEHFTAPNPTVCAYGIVQPTNWDNHRVVRYRTALALLQDWFHRFSTAFTPEYQEVALRATGEPPCSYSWNDDAQRTCAETMTAGIVKLDQCLTATGEGLSVGAPRPQPDFVIRPSA